MEEPTSAASGVLLGKCGVVMAAFLGSILSLGYMKDLARGQAATAVATGFFFCGLPEPSSCDVACSKIWSAGRRLFLWRHVLRAWPACPGGI